MVNPPEVSINLRGNAAPATHTVFFFGDGAVSESHRLPSPNTLIVWTKGSGMTLGYCPSAQETAKSGERLEGNHHLRHLVESCHGNVGDPHVHVKVSSPPRARVGVGAAIVLGARESRVQGEGPQFVGTSRQTTALRG
jgi:hypothetical protein